jgi:hypothetical protein
MTSEAEKMRVSFHDWLKQSPGAMPLIWHASLAMVFKESAPVMVYAMVMRKIFVNWKTVTPMAPPRPMMCFTA